MHIISRKMLLDADARHGDLAGPLDAWYRITKKADWKTIVDLRADFPAADLVGKKTTVFDIKGNEYRLIAEVFYSNQTVLVRAVLTHAEYDKGKWNDQLRHYTNCLPA